MSDPPARIKSKKGNEMPRKLDPISLAMLEYIQAVDQVFGLSTPRQQLSTTIQLENEKESN
jgi:hypothetical protein